LTNTGVIKYNKNQCIQKRSLHKKTTRKLKFNQLLWINNLVHTDDEISDWHTVISDYHQLWSWLTGNVAGTLDGSNIIEILKVAKAAHEQQSSWTDDSPMLLEKVNKGELLDVDWKQIANDELSIVKDGLDNLLNNRSASLRYLGKTKEELITYLAAVPNLDIHRVQLLFELLDHGQTEIMRTKFVPNGGLNFTQSTKYRTHQILCAHEIATRQKEGRMVVLHESAIRQRYQLHYSRLTTASKFQSTDRMCFDLTSAIAKGMSFNRSIDDVAHLSKYPRDVLPTLSDICEFMCNVRSKFPQCTYLDGSTVDVRTAYNQYTIRASKSKLLATRIFSPSQPGIPLVALPVTGVFGEKYGGEPLTAVFTYMINKILNSQTYTIMDTYSIRWALPYVDDIMMVAPALKADWTKVDTSVTFDDPFETGTDPSGGNKDYSQMEIHACTLSARNAIAHLMGSQATTKKKVKVYKGHLEALGWHFDLHYDRWFVAPKQEKVLKIFYFLFVAIPPTATTATSKSIEIISGLLNWYMSALPMGRCFTHSLFKLGHKWKHVVDLSPMAIRDLSFWRALILSALTDISILGAPIASLCLNMLPSWFIHTDASTGIGGGGFLSSMNRWRCNTRNSIFVLRWTVDELEAIKLIHQGAQAADTQMQEVNIEEMTKYMVHTQDIDLKLQSRVRKININVLEFASAVYALLLWSFRLQGQVVDIGTDNTACLCWLVKQKAQSISADRLLKILAINCIISNIRIRSHFIPGINNLIPDYLSRNLECSFLDQTQEAVRLAGRTKDNFTTLLVEDTYTHQQLCRAIIHRSLTVDQPLTVTELLATVTALQRHTAGVIDINEPWLMAHLDRLGSNSYEHMTVRNDIN
jgi:hypothetical protein